MNADQQMTIMEGCAQYSNRMQDTLETFCVNVKNAAFSEKDSLLKELGQMAQDHTRINMVAAVGVNEDGTAFVSIYQASDLAPISILVAPNNEGAHVKCGSFAFHTLKEAYNDLSNVASRTALFESQNKKGVKL